MPTTRPTHRPIPSLKGLVTAKSVLKLHSVAGGGYAISIVEAKDTKGLKPLK